MTAEDSETVDGLSSDWRKGGAKGKHSGLGEHDEGSRRVFQLNEEDGLKEVEPPTKELRRVRQGWEKQ